MQLPRGAFQRAKPLPNFRPGSKVPAGAIRNARPLPNAPNRGRIASAGPRLSTGAVRTIGTRPRAPGILEALGGSPRGDSARPAAPAGLIAGILGKQPAPGGVTPVGRPDVMNPTAPAAPSLPGVTPGINPYTGQPLGPNEYVGVAGSEAENPGKKRIPPPGWWDPSNPNYERRSYYSAGEGRYPVGIEAGFDDPENRYNTGREGEANKEYYSRGGEEVVRMDEPGVPRWGPGQTRSTPSAPYAGGAGPAISGALAPLATLGGNASHPQALPPGIQALLQSLLGGNTQAAQGLPPDVLQALIQQLRGRIPGSYPA